METTNIAVNRNLTSNFFLTAKKEIIDNRKAILLGAASCWALCILLGAFMGFWTMGGNASEVFIFGLMFGGISSIAGSLMFANMKTKESRISTILLPASAFDKFIVRWIAIVPGLFAILIAGFYIGDLTRIFVNWINNSDAVNPDYNKITDIWGILTLYGMKGGHMLMAIIFASYFLSQSIYMFGAILWPKLSFIKTLVALWALQMIGAIVITVMRHCFSFTITDESILWWVFTIEIALTLALYASTYLRFKNSQVVYKLF